MTIKVTPLGSNFGVEIGGVDLTLPLDQSIFADIKRVLIEKQVVVISDVPTDVKILVDFGRRFGTLRPHILSQYHHPDTHEVAVVTNDPATGLARTTSHPAGSFWHADLTYERNPCDVSFLYSVEVPDEGGDTRFADMIGAYEGLPADLKKKIEGLTAIHRYGGRSPHSSIVGLSEEQKVANPDVEHPVVRRIPETGRKSLYINPAYTVQLVGCDEKDSDSLLEELFGYALSPEFEYRHKWRDQQVVFFDNRTTMHSATPDYSPDAKRTLYRMFVAFEDPS